MFYLEREVNLWISFNFLTLKNYTNSNEKKKRVINKENPRKKFLMKKRRRNYTKTLILKKKKKMYNGWYSIVELLGIGNDTCINELVPRVGQAGQTPVDTIGVGGGVGLLLGGQHLPLPDCVDGGVGVFPVLR